MFGLEIVEVAIGMAFLYLFMSMIASALREAFETFLKDRATDLERGITEMLRTDSAPDSKDVTSLLDKWRNLLPTSLVGRWQPAGAATMAQNLYDHPMVSSLFKGTYKEAQGTKELPSYIPKENFALAILDLVAKASETGNELSIATLKGTLAKVTNPNAVQRAVLLTLSTAGNDLDKVRKGIEDWYDSTMQRVTGWYAKRTAVFLFIFGLGAAAALNVDSIAIVKRLISDPPLRQSIVKQAETYAQKTSTPPSTESFDALRRQFGEIGYPIGWTKSDDGYYPIPQACTAMAADKARPDKVTYACDGKNYIPMLLLALMGWLITAIAIMLGAPFWFDLLKKLISLRTALNPDEQEKKDDSKKGGRTKRGGPGKNRGGAGAGAQGHGAGTQGGR